MVHDKESEANVDFARAVKKSATTATAIDFNNSAKLSTMYQAPTRPPSSKGPKKDVERHKKPRERRSRNYDGQAWSPGNGS